MSKLSPKEFSAASGIAMNTLKSHYNRKKFVKDTAGLIDTDDEVNKRYINEQTQGRGLFTVAQVAPDGKKEKVAPAPKILNETEQAYQDLDLRKKQADALNAEQASELKRIQLEKAAGNLLPLEIVEKIIVINIQSIFKVFTADIEKQASIYNEVFGGTRKELAVIIEKQREVLAESIIKAQEDANTEIEIAVREYQDQRTQGEKK